jgi:hypothetical protein
VGPLDHEAHEAGARRHAHGGGSRVTHILYVVAFVCFALAAFGVNSARVNLVAAGLACLTATLIL